MSLCTIAVIGAAGDVGTELCVTLAQFKGVRAIAICRYELEAVLLRRCGIECRFGSMDDAGQAQQLLADCNVVIDLSVPRGLPSEYWRSTRTMVRNAMACAPAGARYIYSSSLMAFGMKDPEERVLRRHVLARSLYGVKKRWAEKEIFRVARRFSREAYVLRVGLVHGVTQANTNRLVASLRSAPEVKAFCVPVTPSNTVFVFTVAEAAVNIARGREKPGLYTLVSVPQWSWKEVVQYCAAQNGVSRNVVEVSVNPPVPKTGVRHMLRTIVGRTLQNRDVLAGYLLCYLPFLERRAKAFSLRRRARRELAVLEFDTDNEVFRAAFWGDAPGKRLAFLSDSRSSMNVCTQKVRNIFRELEARVWAEAADAKATNAN
jgi:nucleoside-diphosphate-sugar epimerase